MDPLSITAGVVGVLSSLSALSMRVNDFRKDVKEATSEINQVALAVDALTKVLQSLEEARTAGKIAGNLIGDLGNVLQGLNATVIETTLFLKKTEAKTLRGAYWAFTGKNQCSQLCCRLESYKSTLNITLTMSEVISGHVLHDKADQILNGINQIRQHLPATQNDYILQKFLAELETVYEGSTIAGEATRDEFDDRNHEPQPPPVKALTSPAPGVPAPSEVYSSQFLSQGPEAKQTRSADIWSRGVKSKPTMTQYIRVDSPLSLAKCPLFISQEDKVAGWYTVMGDSFGVLFGGRMNDFIPSLPLTNIKCDPQAGGTLLKKGIRSIAFREDGCLLVVFFCTHSTILDAEKLTTSWIEVFKLTPEALTLTSSSLYGFHKAERSALSPNGRYYAHQHDNEGSIDIFRVETDCEGILSLDIASHSAGIVVHQMLWSRNGDRLLVHYTTSEKLDLIEVFSIPGGSKISSNHLNDNRIRLEDLKIFNVSSYMGRVGETQNKSVTSQKQPDLPTSIMGQHRELNAISGISTGTGSKYLQLSVMLDNQQLYIEGERRGIRYKFQIPKFSSDGSCFVGKEESRPTLHLVDSSSGHFLTKLVPDGSGNISQFDFDGQRLVVLQKVDQGRTIRVQSWEAALKLDGDLAYKITPTSSGVSANHRLPPNISIT